MNIISVLQEHVADTKKAKIREVTMCESNVYIKKDEAEELVMENVASITPIGEKRYLLRGLLGDSAEVEGEIADINLMAHKIIFV